MKPKLDFLLEFYEYIENIDKYDSEKDKNIFTTFKDYNLIEGLIWTVENTKSLNIILRRFKDLVGSIEQSGEIFLEGNFSELNNYLPLFNNLGYFISKITLDGQNWIKNYDNNTIPVALYLEAKFDTKITKIPKILYHATLEKNKNKIFKIGLIPKSNNKLSNHPDRIYLTDNLIKVQEFAKYLQSEYKENTIILKINTTGLDINLYKDINMTDGYYTLNNIGKDFIENTNTL